MRYPNRVLVALAALAPAAAGAQQWRTVETARQLTATDPLAVTIRYAAGHLELRPVEGRLLYQMRIRYDEQAMDALHQYDAADHRLQLGLRSANVGWRAMKSMHGEKGGSMSVGLTSELPMALDVELGGVEADMDLGGLRITQLKLASGLAGVKVDFSSPNAVVMERMSLDLGLGGLKLENVGNANVAEISIDGGLGGIALDFGDVVAHDVKINADMALGELRIGVPRNVGVMVQGDLKGGTFDRQIGFMRKDNAWYSLNWNEASRRITVVTSSTLANLKVVPTGQ
ncbi:MAG TPA: hypothetical protein VHM30_00820 [Gemmatimonadaceae bacterium]|nr:hypothetical protein [Gemmatimonadaceae bacterium]